MKAKKSPRWKLGRRRKEDYKYSTIEALNGNMRRMDDLGLNLLFRKESSGFYIFCGLRIRKAVRGMSNG